ncbi:DUF3040 domain-containing protein [Streptomyces sp. T1317-0309]|nr:DUF3040 domain-containing protein [Streptomyces sp. T1317-0309]
MRGGTVAYFDDRQLKDFEEQLEQSDPRFTQALDPGRPRRRGEYRHAPVWRAVAPYRRPTGDRPPIRAPAPAKRGMQWIHG